MILKLPVELTIARALELRNMLLSAIDDGEALLLDASEVEEIDVAGLQLLCSTHRSAAARHKPLAFVEGTREVIDAAMRVSGLPRHRGSLDGCLWKETEHA